MLNQAMHQILKTQVLEILVPKMQEIVVQEMQETHQTALVTQLEIVTNF